MASKHSKSTSLQLFSEQKRIRWKRLLQELSESSGSLVHLFEEVFSAQNQQQQLKAIKKVRPCLQQLSSPLEADKNHVVYSSVLQIIAEIHCVCDSRHPLQRAIVSIFQGLPKNEHGSAVRIISANVADVFSECQPDSIVGLGEYSVVVGKKMEYLEALMENFKLGEAALTCQLPTVLKYCVQAVLNLSSKISSSQSMGLLLAVLKATMNLMHKLAIVISQMLSKELENDCIHNVADLNWTGDTRESTPLERSKWTYSQLSNLEISCEHLLSGVDSIPHDVTVAAAMVTLVVFNINHGSSSLDQTAQSNVTKQSDLSLSAKLQRWFSELKPFAQLAVCHGVLAKLPPPLLLSTQLEGQPLLVALFPKVCKLFDSFTETSDRCLASRTIALWTSVTRDCAQSISPSSILYEYVLPSGEIMQKLLQLVWSLWEDPVDAIRHQCRDMFENVVKIYQHLQNCGNAEDYLLTLARSLLSLESHTRGKFILLASLSHDLSASKFLIVSPQLPSELMSVMGHQALACHAGDLWTSLVNRHWKELNNNPELTENIWSKTWVSPLVEAMCTSPPLARRHIVQHCLPVLFQCSVNCMQHITANLNELDLVSADSKLTTQLACLRCAKMECRGFDAAASDSFEDLFATAMHHADEQIRLSALGLLCESHRTTEPPLSSHLKLLFHFVELNANSQSPGFRYPALTAFKKLFIRIRDSSYAMLKLHQKGRCDSPKLQIASFQNFLQELMEQQFKVLHPLSSFQRRSFSLSLLQLAASIFDAPNSSSASNPTNTTSEEETSNFPPVFDFPCAITSAQSTCLFDGLQDAFDANRYICLELLLMLPVEKIGFTDSVFMQRQAAVYLNLVQSPKSVSCTTAAFQLKFYLQKCCASFVDCLSTLFNKDETLVQEEKEQKPPFFKVLDLLCKLLKRHISNAKKDLVESSMTSPIYGVIQSIRAVYECLGAATYAQDCQHHREMMVSVISICDDVAELVSPVVCSSSPEGFLPNEDSQSYFKEHPSSSQLQENAKAASKEGVQSDCKPLTCTELVPEGNAQSLLLCCWHSMKEIALLLGYLTEHIPVVNDSVNVGQKGVITHNQLDTIAKIFIHQLTEARHRGAFEMAYSGFSKLCRCLWTSSSPDLNQKPQKWVLDLLESLQSTSLARLLSITRRSAGLPFYLQAILTAEPAHTGRVCLKSTMETLLTVATENTMSPSTVTALVTEDTAEQPSSSSTSSQPAAVHALNILRALYRDSRLGEHIVPFIPQGVMIAIEGFSAPLWPVRNSSTLLFSALVTRIFGAKRVQDEHSMENKMTAKEFFMRFPTLHNFLLEQLKEGVKLMKTSNNSSLQPSLFPVLLLLSRLYPSPLDEANSPISMKPFLPLLISCTCCSVWKTRVLVAHTITSMITEQNAPSLLNELYGRMGLTNQNSLHGLLLVVEMTVKDQSKLLLRCSQPAADGGYTPLSLSLLALHLDKRSLASRHNQCGITKAAYLRVLLSLLQVSMFSHQDERLLKQIGELLIDCYQAIHVQSCSSKQLFDEKLSILQLNLLLKCSLHINQLGNLDFDGAKLPDPTDLLKLCLKDTYPLSLRTFCLEFVNTALSDIRDDVITDVVLGSLCCETDPDYLIQAYHFASANFMRKPNYDVIPRAYELTLRQCNRLELRISLIHFLSAVLEYRDPNISSKYLRGLVAHWEGICIPTQPCEVREAVAQDVPRVWSASLRSSCREEVIPACCQLVVNLLQDSDVDVRICVATSVPKLLPADVGLSVECPNPSSAMEWFVKSIPVMISDPHLSLSTLLQLVRGDPDDPLTNCSSNPLFDEDPINDYAEYVVLLQHVTSALRDLLTTHKELSHGLVSDLFSQDGTIYDMNVSIPAWDNPKDFKKLVRRHFLRSVLKKSDITTTKLKQDIKSVHDHPIFNCWSVQT